MEENKTNVKDESKDLLLKAAEPLIKYLAENHHPHVTANVTSTSIELVEGIAIISNIDKFLVD